MGEMRVNLKYIDASTAVKNVIGNVNRMNAPRLEADRARKGHAVTVAGAETALSIEEALALELGQPVTEEQATALRDHVNSVATYVDDILDRMEQGDAGARWELLPAGTLLGELEARRETSVRRAARTLEAQKIPSEARRSRFRPEQIGDLIHTIQSSSDADIDAIAARLRTLRTDEQKRTFWKQASSFANDGRSMAYEAWINALLSGPQTHVVNALSNTLTTLWAVPERAIAGQFGNGVVSGEASALLHGLTRGMVDGFRMAQIAFKTGKPAREGYSKLEMHEPAITAGAFGQEGNSVGQAIDWLGTVIRLPSRLLVTGDAFFYAVNFRMELSAQALRQAVQGGFTGDALVREVARLEANPSAVIKDNAEAFALLQTFSNRSDLGTAIGEAANKIPGARVVLPFINTPTNIFLWTMQRTPGLNFLSSQWRGDVAAGGARRDMALARVSMGTLTAATVATLAAAGMITGGGPKDPDLKRQLRDSGWQPYSIKVGDTYYSYNRLDPIGAIFGIVADSSEIIGQLPEYGAAELAAAVGLATSKAMISKTYLEGLSSTLDAIHDPDRNAAKFARGWARTMVPTLIRTVERTHDPTIREVNSLMDEIRASVPGYSADLPPRRNLFGEAQLLSGGLGPDIISPIYSTTRKDDPLADEMVRLKLDISMPSRVLAGSRPPNLRLTPERAAEGVEMTPKEYDYYVRQAGNELKDPSTGLGMRDYLERMIEGREYQRQTEGPDGGKAWMFRRVVHTYREAAKAQLLQESPELARLVGERREDRMRALSPDLQTHTAAAERQGGAGQIYQSLGR